MQSVCVKLHNLGTGIVELAVLQRSVSTSRERGLMFLVHRDRSHDLDSLLLVVVGCC